MHFRWIACRNAEFSRVSEIMDLLGSEGHAQRQLRMTQWWYGARVAGNPQMRRDLLCVIRVIKRIADVRSTACGKCQLQLDEIVAAYVLWWCDDRVIGRNRLSESAQLLNLDMEPHLSAKTLRGLVDGIQAGAAPGTHALSAESCCWFLAVLSFATIFLIVTGKNIAAKTVAAGLGAAAWIVLVTLVVIIGLVFVGVFLANGPSESSWVTGQRRSEIHRILRSASYYLGAWGVALGWYSWLKGQENLPPGMIGADAANFRSDLIAWATGFVLVTTFLEMLWPVFQLLALWKVPSRGVSEEKRARLDLSAPGLIVVWVGGSDDLVVVARDCVMKRRVDGDSKA